MRGNEDTTEERRTASARATTFAGQIGRTVEDSVPAWDPRPRHAAGAPNVVVVVLDDTGWADLGCFGSEIATPVMDAIAEEGLRFNNFHVTPLCSPTRASFLTGRNHHRVGMRFLAVTDTGFPNSRGCVTPGCPTVPELLRDHGYGTYLVGKWHLTPQAEITPAGPYANWPLARGFDRFYGYLGGASDQHLPELFRDHSPIPAPTAPGYHLSSDLVDNAISLLSDHIGFRPDDPFFLQLAFGATHAPFQAPAEYVDRYGGVYDEGWDLVRERRFTRQRELGVVPGTAELTERDDDVPLWDDLTPDEQRLSARIQQAYAGFLEHADAQLGRLIEWLRQTGQLDNTLIAVFSDNGAAGDGGRLGATSVIGPYNGMPLPLAQELGEVDNVGDRDHPAHYATGWAATSNTPFRLYKQFVDLGGVRSPLILRWPSEIESKGEIRDQFCHVIDLAATIAEIATSEKTCDTDGNPIFDGASMLGVIQDAASAHVRDVQYFEMLGHRGIWHDGWKAVTRHVPGTSYESDVWRLYDTNSDFAETRNIAERHPDVLRELERLWWAEAEANGVLPLDDRPLKVALSMNAPGAVGVPTRLVLRPGQSHVNFTSRLTGSDRDLEIRARLRGRRAGDSGVLLASGASYGGYALYIHEERLVFEHHLLGERISVSSQDPVPVGACELGVALRRHADRSATASLFIGDKANGHTDIPRVALQPAMYGMDVGKDVAGVGVGYARRVDFTLPDGVLRDVTLNFGGIGPLDELATHLEASQ